MPRGSRQKSFTGWIPFGGGRRRCVGSHMALLEMKVVIKAVLERVDLEAPSHRGERARIHHLTLIPARGALLTVRSRSDAPVGLPPSAFRDEPAEPVAVVGD
jgi:cytochrome P450